MCGPDHLGEVIKWKAVDSGATEHLRVGRRDHTLTHPVAEITNGASQ